MDYIALTKARIEEDNQLRDSNGKLPLSQLIKRLNEDEIDQWKRAEASWKLTRWNDWPNSNVNQRPSNITEKKTNSNFLSHLGNVYFGLSIFGILLHFALMFVFVEFYNDCRGCEPHLLYNLIGEMLCHLLNTMAGFYAIITTYESGHGKITKLRIAAILGILSCIACAIDTFLVAELTEDPFEVVVLLNVAQVAMGTIALVYTRSWKNNPYSDEKYSVLHGWY